MYLFFDKADAVGDAALARVTEGCIKAGIRHADDDIRLHGMLEREERARALACDVDALLPSMTESGRAK